MKIYKELGLRDFEAWSGAINTKDIILEHGLEEEFNNLIDELYPNGLSDTQLNDILWFDDTWVFETLGINIEE